MDKPRALVFLFAPPQHVDSAYPVNGFVGIPGIGRDLDPLRHFLASIRVVTRLHESTGPATGYLSAPGNPSSAGRREPSSNPEGSSLSVNLNLHTSVSAN